MVFEFVNNLVHEWKVARSLNRTEEYSRVESSRQREILGKYIHAAGLESRNYKRDGVSVMVVNDGGGNIGGSEMAMIISGLDYTKKRTLFFECFQVADEIVAHNLADGKIATFGGDGYGKLLNYGSHCVNYLELEQGIAAIDYTARENIDMGQGNLDVLVVVAEDLPQLFSRVSSIYGGNWEMIQND